MIQLWKFHGGLHLDGHKELSNSRPITPVILPSLLILPLLQHIGEPTEPIVGVGEKVLKGQVVARCRKDDCGLKPTSPIHASTSGTVVAIEHHSVPHPSGLDAPCIIIETDGQDTWVERTYAPDYAELPPSVIRELIAQAGIVGLGGAGFPSHLKLKPEGIDTLIINGAECEPYITCDDRLMREYPKDIIAGAQILRHVLGGAERCIIAIEDNKPEAYRALSDANEGQVEVIQVPTLYPTGGERQLIQILTGKEISRQHLPAQFGIVVHNIETTRAIYRAIHFGQPLLSRVMTVTGNGVRTPQNLEVLIGTPIRVLLDHCGRQPAITRLIMGGSMMGFTLPDEDIPVIKTTNCLIASCSDELQPLPPTMPCIRCGACAEVCPIRLLPQQLYWHARSKDFEKAKEYHLFECIDCGCCAYVCPSHIPLVSYYRYAKAEIRAIEKERQQADLAKKRFEFRKLRLEREKQERLARHQQKASTLNNDTEKKALIAAALERVNNKKIQEESTSNPTK